MTSERRIDTYRDSLFVNPKTFDRQRVELLMEQLNATLSGGEVELARTIIGEYARGARRFNELSAGQLHPSDNIPGILAHMASVLFNNNLIVGEVSPIETLYENEAIDWIGREVVGYDMSKDGDVAGSGAIVNGGTSANLHALYAARERLESQGWDGATPSFVLTAPMAHYSIEKAVRMMGGSKGAVRTRYIEPIEGSYKTDPQKLRETIDELRAEFGQFAVLAVVGLAGETETGLVDDLQAIADITEENELFFHVDGAYGAPFALSRNESLLRGMSRADTVTCDPHKYLYVPYNAGAILFRDREDHARLANYNSQGNGYMFQDDKSEHAPSVFGTYNGRYKLEGSMGGFAAAATYFSIQSFGREGYGAILDHTLDMAAAFEGIVCENGGDLTLLAKPELNTVCVLPTGDDVKSLNRRVAQTSFLLDRDDGIYISNTKLRVGDHFRSVFRFVPTHPHTGIDEVSLMAEQLFRRWRETDK